METLIQIAQLILCLSFLVILHELGHFLPAKYFKTKIEKFYLFFDPWFSLVKKKIGDTEYGIGWLPMGGYVKIAGMIDESMDKEQLKQEPQPWEYRSKPAWQRLIIILGGVIVNFILAWLIYAVIFSTYGQKFTSSEKFQANGLAFSEAAKMAGFEDGDKILSVDGTYQPQFERMVLDVLLGEEVLVERKGQQMTISLTDERIKAFMNGARKGGLMSPRIEGVVVDSIPRDSHNFNSDLKVGDVILAVEGFETNFADQLAPALNNMPMGQVVLKVQRGDQRLPIMAHVNDEHKLGVVIKTPAMDQLKEMLVVNHYGFFEALPLAAVESWTSLNYQIKQFKLIIRPETEAYKQVSGPLRLFKVFSPEWNWEHFWKFTAMFSVWLGFINLLPIPGLDGGHAMFILMEVVTRKKPTEKTLEIAQTIGVVILLSLMALVFGNDIWHLIQGT
jgi:regulator of sigma E protease